MEEKTRQDDRKEKTETSKPKKAQKGDDDGQFF